MKKSTLLAAAILSSVAATAQVTSTNQMEKISRGVVALPAQSGEGKFISWRWLGYDEAGTSFDLLRNGEVIAHDITKTTSYTDAEGTSSSQYQVVTKVNGVEIDKTEAITPWSELYSTLQLNRPAAGSNASGTYTYTPNDCSIADVDGDGEYELIVKWDPSNQKDNSQSGYTGNVYLDCYKFNGTQLWRIDLGVNIRAGAHYTQFQVFDYDGDGKAELICKTAPGSIDGKGKYVSSAADETSITSADNSQDYRNSKGYILSGPEYLTVFKGESGEAIHTVWYNPNRAGGYGVAANHPSKSYWGDNYGNRVDRFLACTAYLDGEDETPSAVFGRGYYTRAYVWAVKFDGKKLSTKWLHSSISKNEWDLTDANGTVTKHTGLSNTAYGNGNHNLSVGDVDGDGKDEIIYGSCAFDHDGSLLYTTALGHGDAMHLADLDPDRPGLEIFTVHEDKPYGMDIHDAATGEILTRMTGTGDTGRGIAADVDSLHRGAEIAGVDNYLYDLKGNNIGKRSTLNFRIYWDGDAYEELFDGKYSTTTLQASPRIEKYTNGSEKFSTIFSMTSYGKPQTCNTTKSTPCLQADLFGDWREELIMWNGDDPSKVNIYTTNIPTSYRVPTLMHDHIYRMGIAWQNTAYNQPPHIGYYLPDYLKKQEEEATSIREMNIETSESNSPIYNIAGQKVDKHYKGIVIKNGKKIFVK